MLPFGCARTCRALAGCGLQGGLPPELAGLPRLQLIDLSHNRLMGGIPKAWTAVGSLPALQTLQLGEAWAGMGGLAQPRLKAPLHRRCCCRLAAGAMPGPHACRSTLTAPQPLLLLPVMRAANNSLVGGLTDFTPVGTGAGGGHAVRTAAPVAGGGLVHLQCLHRQLPAPPWFACCPLPPRVRRLLRAHC